MSPRAVRGLIILSIGVSVAVLVNALVLQGRPGLASFRSTAQKPDAQAPAIKPAERPQVGLVQRRGGFEPTSETIRQVPMEAAVLPSAPGAEGDAAVIRTVKRALTERGYGPLAADQKLGLTARAAILAFEFDHGLPLAGEATEDLLGRLTSPALVPHQKSQPNPRIASPAAEAVLRHVQSGLTQLGYAAGRIDGRLGEQTQKAIRDFEHDQGLSPRGRVSTDVVSRLAAAIAKLKP